MTDSVNVMTKKESLISLANKVNQAVLLVDGQVKLKSLDPFDVHEEAYEIEQESMNCHESFPRIDVKFEPFNRKTWNK